MYIYIHIYIYMCVCVCVYNHALRFITGRLTATKHARSCRAVLAFHMRVGCMVHVFRVCVDLRSLSHAPPPVRRP